jgi:hypothetical protein
MEFEQYLYNGSWDVWKVHLWPYVKRLYYRSIWLKAGVTLQRLVRVFHIEFK